MYTPQAGIFALGTSSHAYLEFDLVDPKKYQPFAASVAAAEVVARQPDIAADNDVLAGQVADVVFQGHAPRGAGTPTVAVKSSAAAVTATVGYEGLAPSNFGSVLGYDAVSADASSTSLARVADFRPTLTR